jgi:hypothetical protein
VISDAFNNKSVHFVGVIIVYKSLLGQILYGPVFEPEAFLEYEAGVFCH